ncbi:MAG: hypothetical protein D8M59_13970 [Planctomycetes bacterium]|nr:hypothetical protein [Planctomycetota bacterium]
MIGAALLSLLAGTAAAQTAAPVVYSSEAEFLADIASLGYEAYREGFEGPAWDHVRSTDPFNLISATSVTNLGITWHARPDNMVTTNTNWGQRSWGIFEDQRSGFSSSELFGVADRVLYAVGGWINTSPDGGDMTIEVNGQIVDGVKIGFGHHFVGVIDTVGFTEFRVLDMEQHTVWGADNFTYAAARAPQIELDFDPVCPNGGQTRLAWAGGTPGGQMAIVYGPNLGSLVIPNNKPCAGTLLDLSASGITVGYTGKSNAQGEKELMVNVPSNVCGWYIQAVDLTSCEVSAAVMIE